MKDEISIIERISQNISFTCNGVSYSQINIVDVYDTGVTMAPDSYGCVMRYDKEWIYDDYVDGDFFWEYRGWEEDVYKTIDFGTESQSVSTTFFDWFMAHASKIN